jgi:hypothetical protein
MGRIAIEVLKAIESDYARIPRGRAQFKDCPVVWENNWILGRASCTGTWLPCGQGDFSNFYQKSPKKQFFLTKLKSCKKLVLHYHTT